MSDGGIDDLVGQIPIGQLAAQLGVSEDEAERAVRAALPALLGGMQANAGDPAGAASLARALGDHDGSLLEGGADLDQVDTDDGARIVRNVFGGNEGAVVDRLGGLDGLSSGLMGKLLPMLAPLLLAFLSKQVLGGSGGGGGGGADAPSGSSPGSASGMGPGAGGMAPGGPADAGSGGGGLGDILGGLLGGGGGGLGDVLGGLLGGGKR